jgi:hypothetical protein
MMCRIRIRSKSLAAMKSNGFPSAQNMLFAGHAKRAPLGLAGTDRAGARSRALRYE